jgi:hypothetical protein
MALAFLWFHRALLIAIDQPALSLRPHFRALAWLQRQMLVVDQDSNATTSDRRPHRGKIEQHDVDFLCRGVFPEIALGPVRQRLNAH